MAGADAYTLPMLPDIIAFANRLADTAGEIVRRYFRGRLTRTDKTDGSPVTEADCAIERAIRDAVDSAHPDHGVLGEEFGAHRLEAEYLWVIDPIDGTKAFISGVPLFGTLIGLLHRGRPVLGVIDQAVTGERWLGADGVGTTLNGEAVRVRPCGGLAEAVLFATTPVMFAGVDEAPFKRLAEAVKWTRYSADCYAYGLLASGFVDLAAEAGLKPYDYCALVPVVANAGGVISDWRGAPLGLESDGRVLAAGDPGRHAEALAMLAA